MKGLILSILIFVALGAQAQKWKPVDAQFDSITDLCEQTRNHLQIPRDYEKWVHQMHAIADKHGSKVMKWRALFWEAWLAARYNQHDKERQCLEQAMGMVDSVKYEYDYHRLKWDMHLLGNWNNVLPTYRLIKQELKYYESVDDKLMLGLMNLNIGRLFDQLQMARRAIEYNKKGHDYYMQIGFTGAAENGLIDDVRLYCEVGDTARAREAYRQVLKSERLMSDTMARMGLLANVLYTGLDPNAATEAYRLAKEYGRSPSMLAVATENMGEESLLRGDYHTAISYMRDALKIDLTGDMYDMIVKRCAMNGLYQCYAQLERWDSAYYFLDRYTTLRDSIAAINDQEAFFQDLERTMLEQEDAKFDLERRQARVRLIVIIFVGVVMLMAAVAVAWWLHVRRRLKEAENERLAAEVEREQMERQLYQQQCEDRERELTTNSLLLIEKKKMIESLNHQIEQCGEEGKIDKDARRRLLNFIRTHSGTEESLQQFYDYFNQVNPDFFMSLKQEHPGLTNGDLRLCAYIRMGLDNKQISQVMSIQPDAIKKARYRLRKKLGLQTTDSLEDFLMLRPDRNPEAD